MTALDIDGITRRLSTAQALVENRLEPGWDDPDKAWDDLKELVTTDVGRVLVELEERAGDRDVGHMTGLFAVEQWLAQHASSPRPGFDPATCRQLAAGAHAMLLAAVGRLGVNPDGCDATDWTVADEAARDERRRVEVESIDGGMT